MVKFYGRFGGKITQEYGNSDSIYFPVDPRDYCSCIIDFDDKSDWKKRQYRILDVITTFWFKIKADDLFALGKGCGDGYWWTSAFGQKEPYF